MKKTTKKHLLAVKDILGFVHKKIVALKQNAKTTNTITISIPDLAVYATCLDVGSEIKGSLTDYQIHISHSP